jgi:hypothetical protein
MSDILLSISIPSNNKIDLLLEALKSITSEVKANKLIEINVSDNSGNFVNEDLILNNFKNINYYKSNKYSMDSNIDNAIRISKGKYVWIFGDDDLIHFNVIKKIIEYLINKKPDILILNSSSFIDNEVIEANRCTVKNNKIYSNKDFSNDIFLTEMGGYLTYIGSIIINKNAWINNFSPNFLDTYFCHLLIILKSKIENYNIHYFSIPCIKMRVNSQTWSKKYFEIWNFNFPNVIWNFNKFSNIAKSAVISKNPLNNPLRLLSHRAYGHYNLKIFINYIFKNKKINFLTKLFGFLILFFPQKFISFIYYIYIKIFRKNHTTSFSPKLALKLLNL